ncbi:MAG TPA: hypothetical protein VHL80_19900 [Polyangia bacterium]|nr:hypothetical protein [Polyangia bacterium]
MLSTAALAQGAPPPGAPPPGAPPDPNAAPPAGYPPPPAGYPQAQPGYPQAQPGYPPPQPGYPPPQPGYVPQTYAAPPGPPPAAEKHGFLPILYIGVNSFQGKAGDGVGPGFRLGAILGGRINPQISINGEITIDVLNVSSSNLQAGESVTAAEVDLAFSPLYHLQLGPTGEFVVGPKLGFVGGSSTDTQDGVKQFDGSVSGFVFGLNAGMLFSVSPSTEIGALLSFQGRKYTNQCVTPAGGAQACSSDNLPDADKVLGFSGAITF